MTTLHIQMSAIISNAAHFMNLAMQNNMTLTAVTKFCLSNPEIVQGLVNAGIKSIADSNMQNFAALGEVKKSNQGKRLFTSLIKTRVSDIEKIKSLVDEARPNRIFTSDSRILEEIRNKSLGNQLEVVLIVEIGDMKEGVDPRDVLPLVHEYNDLQIIGVSANFSCMSGKTPDMESIRLLDSLARQIMRDKKLPTPFVSVGGTVVYSMLEKGLLKDLVSEIRIGEGIFFGYDSSNRCAIPGLINSAFTLKGEIIEIRPKKIDLPKVKNYNSFGENGDLRKTGLRTCAVLDFGVLGCNSADFHTLEPTIEIAGQTFDYTVVDVTQSASVYKTGEYIDFRVFYAGASQAFLNSFVCKHIENSTKKVNYI